MKPKIKKIMTFKVSKKKGGCKVCPFSSLDMFEGGSWKLSCSLLEAILGGSTISSGIRDEAIPATIKPPEHCPLRKHNVNVSID